MKDRESKNRDFYYFLLFIIEVCVCVREKSKKKT